MNFDEFWARFPHRDNRGSKPRARMIFSGAKPTESGARYSDSDRERIMLGLEAHIENTELSSDAWKYRQSAPVWLYQESHETAIEIKAERDARPKDPMHAERQARTRIRNATERWLAEYNEWRIERGLLNTLEAKEQFRKYEAQRRKLRVVGE